MKITDVKVWLVEGIKYNWTLLKIYTDEGVTGVGEATNWLGSQIVESAAKELGKRIIGLDSMRTDFIWTKLYRDMNWVGPYGASMCAISGIDILVSNAGVNVFEGAERCSEEKWDFNMNLNLKAHWSLSKLCKPYLELKDEGVIIIMTSNHSDYTIPNCFPYNVAKTAIKGLVQSFAIEWAPKIRTIGVAPGFIDTSGNQTWFDSFPDAQIERQKTVDVHPVKKIKSYYNTSLR